MKQQEYDKVLRKCWDNDYFVEVVPTSRRNEYYLKINGRMLKNKETGEYTFKVKPKNKNELNVWQRQKEAYVNIHKRIMKDGKKV